MFSMQQRPHRLQQFLAYKTIAEAIGHARHTELDFRTRATITTNGAQEAAAGSQWTLDFLADTETNVLAVQSRDPKPAALAKGLPTDVMVGFRAITAVFDQQATTLTVAERMEFASKSGEMIVRITQGDQVLYERQLSHILRGVPGIVSREDASNAAAGTPNANVLGEVVPTSEGDDFDDPIIVFPGGSLAIQLIGQGQWVTTDAIPLEIQLHGWKSSQGDSAAASKVARLSDLANANKQALALRARSN